MIKQLTLHIDHLSISNQSPLTLIAGPCQMESRDHALEMAEALASLAKRYRMGFIYKSSFDKANRTSLQSKRGIGLTAALPIFAEIKERFSCPILTDIHEAQQCAPVAEIVDILQIPAFLCRQTDLLVAAARSSAVVNIKKGQFLAPWDIKHALNKVVQSGNERILLTERGVSFGYNNLVSDMRSLAIMQGTGYPVVFDATHSVQQPGGLGGASGGSRRFVPLLARAAVACGIAAIFMETHQDPDHAPSDGPCMVPLASLPKLLETLQAIDQVVKHHGHGGDTKVDDFFS